MTSIDFAAAQQRVIARQQERALAEASRTRIADGRAATVALRRLPLPLDVFQRRSLDLWDAIKGRNGTNPAFRVGQVDAELLDEELLGLFQGQVGEALKLFGSHLHEDWSPEILLALRTILFKLSIWDHNSTYGASLQDLQYADARHIGLPTAPPSKWQKTCYGLLTVLGRYGWGKWESWLSDQENGYEQAYGNIQSLSKITSFLSTAHSIAAFVSFLIFLVNGRYRTLVDRLLRMRLVTPAFQARREVSFEYLNRQLVWHEFTEFLLFLLPLVGVNKWRKWISRAWRKARALAESDVDGEDTEQRHGELDFLPERTCAICYNDQNPTSVSENDMLAVTTASGGIIGSAQTDITNPYETTCKCVYCFVCLATKLEAEEGEGWTCLRCGRLVKECRPWSGDVLEQDIPTAKRVVFSDSAKNTDDDGQYDKG